MHHLVQTLGLRLIKHIGLKEQKQSFQTLCRGGQNQKKTSKKTKKTQINKKQKKTDSLEGGGSVGSTLGGYIASQAASIKKA